MFENDPGQSPKPYFRAQFGQLIKKCIPPMCRGFDTLDVNQRPATTTTKQLEPDMTHEDISSGKAININESNAMGADKVQNLHFVDADPGFAMGVDSQPDSTFSIGATANIDLGDWLSRPQKIYDFSVSTGTTPIAHSFKPWELYFNNPAVKRKLENYALLRCKMKVKFIVNAAPTYFGQHMCSYEPLTDFLPPNIIIPTLDPTTLMPHSQRPHVYLRFSQSQGGTLSLPFFYHSNWLRITDNSDFAAMGTINVLPMTELRNSNGVSGDVTVTVLAWAEEVEVAQTTVQVPLQSQEEELDIYFPEGDEYSEKGPISTVASSIAAVAGRLKDVPYIGRFASATQIASGAIGRIAKIFGYSRVPVIDSPIYVKNVPFGKLATCGEAELVDRLTIDPKQGLTVDPRTVGLLDADELTIQSFVTRESYLAKFEWDETLTAGELLWNSSVTPNLYGGVDPQEQPTPMDYASLPFEYWQGDIIFRFQVVASQYHRGRFLIQWDPIGGTIADYDDVMNLITTQVLDLSISRDVEVKIPFASALPFLKVRNTLRTTPPFSTSPIFAVNLEEINGVISVSVLNELTALGASGPISILVFARADDGMRFMAPRKFPLDLQLVPQSEEVLLEIYFPEGGEAGPDDRLSVEGAPLGSETFQMVATKTTDDKIATVFGGEQVLSFRTFLKRYNYWHEGTFGSSIVDTRKFQMRATFGRYPAIRGAFPAGFGMYPKTGGTYSPVHLTLFNYLACCFKGMRGGMRWKLNTSSHNPIENMMVLRSRELRVEGPGSVITYPKTDTPQTYATLKALATNINIEGYCLTNGRTLTGLEVELPSYSNYRMFPTNQTQSYKGSSFANNHRDSFDINMESNGEGTNSLNVTYALYVATAEDFNFFYFLNAPTIFRYPVEDTF